MENIIVSGCSWTDKYFTSVICPEYNCDYKKWPEYINIDCNINNIGSSGWGNAQIIQSVLKEIALNNNVDRVVIALSNWYRFSVPTNNCGEFGYNINPYLVDSNKRHKLQLHHSKQKALQSLNKNIKVCEYLEIDIINPNVCRYIVNQTMLNIWILYEICKSKNIKLHIFQLLNCSSYQKLSQECLAKEILINPIFKKLDGISNIDLIGWPFLENLGGTSVEYMILPKQDGKYKISPEDGHPNEYGHKLIGEWFNENAKI